MMGWRDELYLGGKGSFRGVQFYVESVDSTYGRRTVTFEFPGRDTPTTQDLGRKARRFVLTCYVLGMDYMIERDKLRKAFEKPGPGPLVHPYLGRMDVVVDGEVTIRESTAEGGMARFTVAVLEAGPLPAPSVLPDTKTAALSAVDSLASKASSAFSSLTRVTRVSSRVVTEFGSLVSECASILGTVQGRIAGVMNSVSTVGAAVSTLGDNAGALVHTPAALASTMLGVLNSMLGAYNSVEDAWGGYFLGEETSNSTAGTPTTSPAANSPASGKTRVGMVMRTARELLAYPSTVADVMVIGTQTQAEADNQAAFLSFYRSAALAEICRIVVDLPMVSYDTALATRDEISAWIEETMLDASDDVYHALAELRAAMHAHLTGAASELPRIISHSTTTTLPALVIAQYLYGDGSRESELTERNGLRDPLLVFGTLEVLSDE